VRDLQSAKRAAASAFGPAISAPCNERVNPPSRLLEKAREGTRLANVARSKRSAQPA